MEEFKKYNDIYIVREGDHFTIGSDQPGLAETEDLIPYDTALGCCVTDSCSAGCLILIKGDKMGFMTVSKYEAIDRPFYFSKNNPFIYDSVEFVTCEKWQEEARDNSRGCLLLEQNGKWGAVEVYQEPDYVKPFKQIIPIEFTKQEVLDKISTAKEGPESLTEGELWDIYRW